MSFCLFAVFGQKCRWAKRGDWQNTSSQEPLLGLALRKFVFHMFLVSTVRCATGFSLSLRKCLRTTTRRTERNNSGQQALLGLSICMRVPYVYSDSTAQRLRGLRLSVTQLPASDHVWGGLSYSTLSNNQGILQAFCKHVLYRFHNCNLRCAAGFNCLCN